MRHITVENIEKEMMELLDEAPMTCANLEKFVLLARTMKYMGKVRREFTEEDAREWAMHMNPPARWTMDQTTAVMQQRGYNHKPCEFWVVMNMLASDYGKTAAKYGVDKPEFWADLTCDFISDADAVDGKVGRYWRDIVKK
jgi:hypothetical protein